MDITLEMLKEEYDVLKESLRCAFCRNFFLHPVFLLSCGHSLCGTCGQKLRQNQLACQEESTSLSTSSNSHDPADYEARKNQVEKLFESAKGTELDHVDNLGSKRGRGSDPSDSSLPPAKVQKLSGPTLSKHRIIQCPLCLVSFSLSSLEATMSNSEDTALAARIKRFSMLDTFFEITRSDHRPPPTPSPVQAPTTPTAPQPSRPKPTSSHQKRASPQSKTSSSSSSSSDQSLSVIPSLSTAKATPHRPQPPPTQPAKAPAKKPTTAPRPASSSSSEPIPKPANTLPLSPSKQEISGAMELFERVKAQQQSLESSLIMNKKMHSKIIETKLVQRDFITASFDDLKQHFEEFFEDKKKTLLKELEERSAAKLSRLTEQRKNLESFLSVVEKSLSFSSSSLLGADLDPVASGMLPQISEVLSRVTHEIPVFQPPVETKHLELCVANDIDLPAFLEGCKLVETPSFEIVPQKAEPITPKLTSSTPAPKIPSPPVKDTKNTTVKKKKKPGPKPKKTTKTTTTRLDLLEEKNVLVPLTNGSRLIVPPSLDPRFIRNPVAIFESPTILRGQLLAPISVAVDKDNNIITCFSKYSGVQIFDENGTFIRAFGSNGTEDGMFRGPIAVAVDRNNNIIVCDPKNQSVQSFDIEGNHIKSFSTSEKTVHVPSCIAIDPHNRILIGRKNDPYITVIDQELNVAPSVLHFGVDERQGVKTIAIDKDNYTFVSRNGSSGVKIYDPSGTFLNSISDQVAFSEVTSMVVDSKRNIIFSDYQRCQVHVFSVDGKHITTFGGKSQFKWISGVTVDHNDRIIVCDSGNFRIQIFDPISH